MYTRFLVLDIIVHIIYEALQNYLNIKIYGIFNGMKTHLTVSIVFLLYPHERMDLYFQIGTISMYLKLIFLKLKIKL